VICPKVTPLPGVTEIKPSPWGFVNCGRGKPDGKVTLTPPPERLYVPVNVNVIFSLSFVNPEDGVIVTVPEPFAFVPVTIILCTALS